MMDLKILNIIEAVTITTFFLSGLVLLFLSKGCSAKKVLGWGMLYVGVVITVGKYLMHHYSAATLQILKPLTILMGLPVAGVFIFYLYELVYPRWITRKKVALIAAPALLSIALYLCGFAFLFRPVSITSYGQLWDNLFSFDILMRILMVSISTGYAVILLILSIRLSDIKEKHIIELYSFRRKVSIDWMIAVAALNFLLCLIFLFNLFTVSSSVIFLHHILSAAMYFFIAIMAFRQETVLKEENPATPDAKDYKEALADEWHGRLKRYMDEKKPYLNSKLTLPQLASEIGKNRTSLSALIHERYGISFLDFINRYRINEFKRILDESGAQNIKISEIYTEIGFQSRTTFYKYFTKHEGVTPSEYLRTRRETKTPEP